MRIIVHAALLFCGALACSSQNLGPPVTCSNVSFDSSNGSCTFSANTACDDGHFYTIGCQDDSTCSCVRDTDPPISVIASNAQFGFCTTVTSTSLHDLAAKCGWNSNP